MLYGLFGGYGWEWVNLVFLVGGFYLIWKKIIIWYIFVGMFGGIFFFFGFFNMVVDVDNYGSILFYMFSGGIMLGVFFIVIDLVIVVISNKGKIIYGVLIGVFIYIICIWGGYLDVIVFSVVLLNLVVLFIDYYI